MKENWWIKARWLAWKRRRWSYFVIVSDDNLNGWFYEVAELVENEGNLNVGEAWWRRRNSIWKREICSTSLDGFLWLKLRSWGWRCWWKWDADWILSNVDKLIDVCKKLWSNENQRVSELNFWFRLQRIFISSASVLGSSIHPKSWKNERNLKLKKVWIIGELD